MYDNGEIMQAYTMEYTNGRKTWTDEDKVKEILTENGMMNLFNIPSPAQLEKQLSHEDWDKLGFEAYTNQTKRKNGFK